MVLWAKYDISHAPITNIPSSNIRSKVVVNKQWLPSNRDNHSYKEVAEIKKTLDLKGLKNKLSR